MEDNLLEKRYEDFFQVYFTWLRSKRTQELPTLSIYNTFHEYFSSREEVDFIIKSTGIAVDDYLTLTEQVGDRTFVRLEITQRGIETLIIPRIFGLEKIYMDIFGEAVTALFVPAPEVKVLEPEEIEDPSSKSVETSAMEVFNYQGNGVTFKAIGGVVMVNATEMAKPFGKQPSDYLRLSTSIEFRQVLEDQISGNSPNCDNQVVTTIKGSSEYGGGTWMHEDLAIHFAMWLAPAFSLWTVQRIKEYMQKGTISKSSAVDFSNPLESAKKVAEYACLFVQSEEGRLLLVAKQTEDEPKVAGYNQMIEKEGLYDFRDIAQVLGIEGYGRTNLVKLMKSGKVKILDKKCVPYQDYISRGYFRIILNLSGAKQTFVTNSGLDFIWRFMYRNKIVTTKLRPVTV